MRPVNPFSTIPAEIRKWAYVAYTLLLTAFGAAQAGFAATPGDQPQWLTVAFAVMGYLGIAFGFTALSNVGTEQPWDQIEDDGIYEEDRPEIEESEPNVRTEPPAEPRA